MTRKWQTILELVFRLISGAFVAFFICVFLCMTVEAEESLQPQESSASLLLQDLNNRRVHDDVP